MLRAPFVIAWSAVLLSAGLTFAQTTNYRSIGSAPGYGVGSVTVVNGETCVIGSPGVQWRSANRGRGDRIRIAGADYTILSVDAENELTLTGPYAGTTSSVEPYTISRKFAMLKDWAECVQNFTPCAGVSLPSLVTDDRVEVGVVFKDSVYFTNTGGEMLKFESSTITDAAHTITLTTIPSNRHHGVEGTGVIIDNDTQTAPAIEILTDFVTIEWIQLQHGGSTQLVSVTGLNPSNQIIVRNSLFRDDDRSTDGIRTISNEVHLLAYNNIFYGLNEAIYIDGLVNVSTASLDIFHNTFFNNVDGIVSSTSSAIRNDVIFLKNNLAHSQTFLDFWVPNPNPASRNNYSGDTSGPSHGSGGVGSILLPTIQFVSPVIGSEDLHIQRGSVAEDVGVVTGSVPDDLDGRLRGTPDIGADETDSSSANPVKILTTKSANAQVQLEWQNPDYGPMERIEIIRSPTAFPATPADGSLSCTVLAPVPGTRGACADGLSLANGTTYYYSAFTSDTGGNYSKQESVTGMPFDTGAKPSEWTYSTKAATLVPATPRGSDAFVVSNDKFFHAMQGGAGPTSGEWPVTGWAPYRLPEAVQHRPVIVDVAGARTALLGAQDGRVYAVRVDTGRLVWKSPILGTGINAAPAALVAAYGAAGGGADHVFVGTADAVSNSLFVLDLQTGAMVGRFDDAGVPTNIGAVSGIAVQYPSGPVYFTSDDGTGGSPRNVWAVDVTTPTVPIEVWSENPGPVDGGPTLYRGILFVGSRASELLAYDVVAGPPWLWRTTYLDGPVKAPIFPVWPQDTLVFTTNTQIHSVQSTATGGCGSPPCLNWSLPLVANASPLLQVPGTDQVFVGLSNGDLQELTIFPLVPMTIPAIRNFPLSSSSLGAPGFSLSQMTIYVSDTSGKVHGIPWPIP